MNRHIYTTTLDCLVKRRDFIKALLSERLNEKAPVDNPGRALLQKEMYDLNAAIDFLEQEPPSGERS